MIFVILGIIILAAILVFGGYIALSVINAAMWMDDSMRWGGRDDSLGRQKKRRGLQRSDSLQCN